MYVTDPAELPPQETEDTVDGAPICPACGEARNLTESPALDDDRYSAFECGECGATWSP